MIPALCTPLIPYVDTIGLAYLHSYPAQASYGPQHYYLFQLTYILVHALSRIATDLHIPPNTQVLLYVLLQSLSCYFTLTYLLLRLIRDELFLCLALLFTPLSIAGGLFLWGGPTVYSLAAVPLQISVVLIVRSELNASRPPALALLLLALLGGLCHPFAIPFFAIVHTAAFLSSRRQRLTSLAALLLIALHALLILRDSPESLPPGALRSLFDFSPSAILARFGDLFTWDASAAVLLFGKSPPEFRLYRCALHAVQLAGIAGLIRPLADWSRRPVLRFLALCYAAFLFLYAVSALQESISWWPQRVLLISGFLLTAFGLLTLSEFAAAISIPERFHRPILALSALLLIALQSSFQLRILPAGRAILDGFSTTRRLLLTQSDARVTVLPAGVARLTPFSLRAIQFMLFPDSDLRARNLRIVTEWHLQPRNNTRLPILPNERQLLLDFRPTGPFEVNPILRPLQYDTTLHLEIQFGPRTPSPSPKQGDPILSTGSLQTGGANLLKAVSPAPGRIRFILSRTGAPDHSSPTFQIDPARTYSLDLQLGPDGLDLNLNGQTWQALTPLNSRSDPQIGMNIAGGPASPVFSGRIAAATSAPARMP